MAQGTATPNSMRRDRSPESISVLDLSWKGGSTTSYETNQGKSSKIEKLSSLREYPNLRVLDLSGNRITNIENLENLGELHQLEELNLSRNIIRRLSASISQLHNLQRLDLQHNFITEIPIGFGRLHRLNWLQLSGNKIADITQVKHLQSCTKLVSLSLFGNPVSFSKSYRATVVNILGETLRDLDDIKVSPKERLAASLFLVENNLQPGNSGSDIADAKLQVMELSAKSSVLEEEIVGMKQSFVAKERTHEESVQKLRSELEATSQLLIRKTADWAKAEETASALRQELAFYKIDHPVRFERVPPKNAHAVMSEKHEFTSDKVDKQQTIVAEDEVTNSVASPRAFEPGAAIALFSTHNTVAGPSKEELDDPMGALEKLEEQIANEAQSMRRKLVNLREKFERAEATRLATRSSLAKSRENLAMVREKFERTRQAATKFVPEQQHATRSTLSMKNVQQLSALHDTLNERCSVLKNLIVIRTQALVGVPTTPTTTINGDQDSQDEPNLDRIVLTCDGELAIRQLEDRNNALFHEVSSIITEMDLIPGLNLDELRTTSPIGEGVLQTSTTSDDAQPKFSLYDLGITRLARDLDLCETTMTLIAARLEQQQHSQKNGDLLHTDGTTDTDDILTDDGSSVVLSDAEMAHITLNSMSALLSAEEATEATIANEYSQRMETVRTMEIQILQLERDWGTRESFLRLRQSMLSAQAVEYMQRVLDTHSRTIMRLEGNLDNARERQTVHVNYGKQQSSPSETDVELSQSCFEPEVTSLAVSKSSVVQNSKPNKPIPLQIPDSSLAAMETHSPSKSAQYWGMGPFSPDARHTAAAAPSFQVQNATVSSASNEETSLKARRKRLYEELLSGERRYVQNLNVLVEVLLMPMRRKSLLKPREMQLVMNNVSRLLVLHTAILNCLEERRSVQVLLKTMTRFIPDFTLYGRYCNGYPASVAIVACRRHELRPLNDFLKSCSAREECGGRDILDYLRLPIERIQEYVSIFRRLAQLSSTIENAEYHRSVLKVNELLQHATQRLELSLDRLHQEAKVAALFHRFVPGKRCDRLSLNDFLRQHEQQVVFNTTSEVLLPGCSQYRNCSVFVCTEGVVIAHVASQWYPSFEEHRPKLIVDGAFRYRLITIAPSDQSDPRQVAINVQRIPVGENRSSLAIEESDSHFGNIRIRSGSLEPIENLMDKYLINCENDQEAAELLTSLESLKSRWLSRRKIAESPRARSRTCSSGLESSDLYDSSRDADHDVSYLPGADMQQRREIAKAHQSRRGSWAAAHSPHAGSLRPHSTDTPASLEGSSRFGGHSPRQVWDEYDFGDEPDDEYVATLRGDNWQTTRRQGKYSSRSKPHHHSPTRHGDKKQPSPFVVVAFGSRVPVEEVKRRMSPCKKQLSSPRPSPITQVATDRFDADSPYNTANTQQQATGDLVRRIDFGGSTSGNLVVEEKGGGVHRTRIVSPTEQPDQIDLSIFRAPKPKGMIKADSQEWTNRHTTQRFIGLPWKESEYIKQRNKVEEALSSPRKR